MPSASTLRWPRRTLPYMRAAFCAAAAALPLAGTPAGLAARSGTRRITERPAPPKRSDPSTSVEQPGRQHTAAASRPPRLDTRRSNAPPVSPVSGRVSSPFGWRQHPISGCYRHHDGIDVAVPLGTAVRSVSPGVVRHVGRRSGYGLVVEVDHAGRYLTWYAHLSASSMIAGMLVHAGQVIGASGGVPGRDGTSTGPHLHFEVRDPSGHALNPAAVLRAPGRRPATAGRGRQVMFSSGRKRSAARSSRHSQRPAAPAFARPLRAGSRGAR